MGVDVHKSVLAYCIGSELRILKEATLANTKEGIKQLIRLCQRFQVQSGGDGIHGPISFQIVICLT
ncbi:MAG: hypothetical protein ACTSYB_03630 [Candidatus Helarchaeota archaeon]